MSLAEIDINSNGRYLPQFDPNAPVTKLEALEEGSEIAATQFADWLADEEQRDDLHDLLSYLAEHELVKKLAERWASQA